MTCVVFSAELWSAIKSSSGNIKFDSNNDGAFEMTLNSNGVGVGVDPSSNLHVNGNALITTQLVIGGTVNTSQSNLHLHGTLGYSSLSYGAGSNQMGNASLIFVDTSSANVTLTLPDLSSSVGEVLTIKRTSNLNSLLITGTGNTLDDYSTLYFGSGNYSTITLFNNGNAWSILNHLNSETLGEIGASDLFLWWKLDETSGNTVSDSSSLTTRSGNLVNNHNFSGNTLSGVQGSALLLDEAYDQINYENGGLSASAYSYSFWVNNTKNSSDDIDVESLIEAKAGFVWGSSNTRFHLGAYHQLDAGGNYSVCNLNSSLSANTWYHIAVTWDGSDIHLYRDGIWQSSNTASSWVSASNVHLSHPGSSANVFSVGNIIYDDVRVFNAALDADKIRGIYQAGSH